MSLTLYRNDVVAEDAPLLGMIGEHPSMKAVYRLVRRVAPTDLPVLIVGETGTGKELVARAVRELSGRPGQLVAFNVCAIADTMFEDALFGHVKGAFTGATSDAPGYLVEAHRGTAFFDEVGGMPICVQAKALRAIETREFRPVGGRADRHSQFRVIAATGTDLRRRVEDGAFRRDLLERLQGLVIHLPPLREREDDLRRLATSFLGQIDHGSLRLSDGAAAALAGHCWPGNVRELRHVVARLALAADAGTITADAVEREVSAIHVPATDPRRAKLADALGSVHWDVERAAAALGVSRATVYRWLRDVGLRRPRLSHES